MLFCELLNENVPADVGLYFLKFSSAMSLFVQLNLNLWLKTNLRRARKYGMCLPTLHFGVCLIFFTIKFFAHGLQNHTNLMLGVPFSVVFALNAREKTLPATIMF